MSLAPSRDRFTSTPMKRPTTPHPVLSCQAAAEHESKVLTEESAEWAAMRRAGEGVATEAIRDYREIRPFPDVPRVLALVGKGHNGGDALLACGKLLADFPRAKVSVLMTAGASDLKPLVGKAYADIEGRVRCDRVTESDTVDGMRRKMDELSDGHGFDLCFDGLMGMAFRPPLREPMRTLIEAVNGYDAIRLRAAVDLPSGKGDESDELFFRADFSYATGIAKRVLFNGAVDCGRVRYLDLGFFDASAKSETQEYVVGRSVLDPLRRLRSASVDKRSFGHLCVVGGSAYMPGALLMTVKAAVSSGVGLVTALAPASIAASLSAQVPEAMWVPWPETSNGTLSPRALPLLLERLDRATAVLAGPGIGRDRNTEMLAMEIVQRVELPVILDGDVLRSRVVEQAAKRKRSLGAVVLTPHMGEYMRMAKLKEPDFSTEQLIRFCRSYRLTTVLKGAITRICDGEQVWFNTRGGPVLSRGGSGDLLAGLIGGNIAQGNSSPPTAIARGVLMHGLAAECLARRKGQVAVHTTEVLDYLPEVLRG